MFISYTYIVNTCKDLWDQKKKTVAECPKTAISFEVDENVKKRLQIVLEYVDLNWNLVHEDGDLKVSQKLFLPNYWLRLELIICLALSNTDTLLIKEYVICDFFLLAKVYRRDYEEGDIVPELVKVTHIVQVRRGWYLKCSQFVPCCHCNFTLVSFDRFHTGQWKPGKLWISTIWLYRPEKLWDLSVSHEMSWKLAENNFLENNKARNAVVIWSLSSFVFVFLFFCFFFFLRTKFMTEGRDIP